MLDSAEAARRRELQHRAYAPGGGLSPDEAEELRDLDVRLRAPIDAAPAVMAPEPVSAAGPAKDDGGRAAGLVDAPRSADGRAAEVAGTPGEAPTNAGTPAHDAGSPGHDAGTPGRDPGAPGHDAGIPDHDAGTPGDDSATQGRAGRLRTRWLLPLVAVIALLLGVGGGWLAFGADPAQPSMTAEQHEVRAQFEASGSYDPGSVRFLGARYGVDVWEATREGATVSCVIITTGDQLPALGCRDLSPDSEETSAQVSMTVEEDGETYHLWAVLVDDMNGDRVAILDRQSADDTWDWRSQYNDAELALADVLVGHGFDGQALNIVGYDQGLPVWLYQAERTCVLVVLDGEEVAESCGSLMPDSAPLDLPLADGVTYSVYSSSMRGPVLTVHRSSDATPIRCDAGTGECASIDDKTGDVE